MTIIAAALLALATFFLGLYLGHRWGGHDAGVEASDQKRRFQRLLRFRGTLPRRPRRGPALERRAQCGRRDHRHPRPSHPLWHAGLAGAAATGRASTAESAALAGC